jgi:aspartyl-tRNA(Asn)/glutamyl-tRNA(Gln) amidotransferase subunit A
VLELLDHRWTAEDFTDAIMARKSVANAMWRFMRGFDLLLTPTVAVTAFALDELGPARINGSPVTDDAWTPFAALANLTGQPAITVPVGLHEGLPVGVQLMGRRLDDATALRAAAALEAALGPRSWPPLATALHLPATAGA